jgi:hypothetical protein
MVTVLRRILPLLVATAVVASCGSAETTTGSAPVSTKEPTVATEPPPTTTTTTAPVVRKDVFVVGDSLTVGCLDFFTTAAEQRAIAFDVSAEIGREIPEGVEQLKAGAAGRKLVVIALGTNDATGAVTDADLTARIDAALGAVPTATPVVWIPPYRDPATNAGKVVDRFNGLLRQAAAKRGNVLVVDWPGFVKQDPKILDKDKIHLTDDGYQKRGEWMARIIRAQLDLRAAGNG